MTFRPLFFLPNSALRWCIDQVYAEKLMDHWVVRAVFSTTNEDGIWFPYKGDEVLWTWPWRRNGLPPFVSLVFSGNGEFGDARYWSLEEIDQMNRIYDETCESLARRIQGEIDKKCIETLIASEPLNAGELVAYDPQNSRIVVPGKGFEPLSSIDIAINQIDEFGQTNIELK